MARKAAPGNGAKDAPEGRAEALGDERPEAPVPEGAADFLPEARLAESPEEVPEDRSAGMEERVEALSEEGLGVVRPAETSPEAPAPEGNASAMPEDWRSVSHSGLSGDPEVTPVEAGAFGAAPVAEESAKADPWRSGSAGLDPALSDRAPLPELGTLQDSRSPTSEPAASADMASSAAVPPPRRRGGVGALLLGGMIAAALGFGAAWLAQDRLGLFPARLPADLEERLAALEARPGPDPVALQSLADRLAEAETRLSALEETPAPAADLEPLREELSQGLAEAQASAAELEERLAALEARPAAPASAEAPLGSLVPEDPGPAVRATPAVAPGALREEILAALEPRLAETEAALAEIEATLSETETALAELDARLDDAESASAAVAEEARAAAASLAEAEARSAAAESQARARAALAAVDAAFDAGEPYEAALAELGSTGTEVPEPLSRRAPEGVPSLSALRESFPEAARAGLAAARAEGLLDGGNGVWDFLSGQLSVRSVTPREGDDPDAVLSRAEANLAAGRLNAALAEVESLPEPVRAAMADWIAQARARAEAQAALAGLRDTLPDAPPAD